MSCCSILSDALKKGNISTLLSQNSTEKTLITQLQKTLYELGFKRELKWDTNQPNGIYDSDTVAAVAAFAKKNKLPDGGTSVSNDLASLLIQRHDFLPEMYVLWSIHKSDLRTKKYISKGTRTSISAIQVLLNTLGFGAQLNFAKYGADGKYGPSTKNAVITYASQNGVQSDGDLLTRPFIDLLLKDINAFYGKDWSDLAVQNMPNSNSPLILFSGSRFMGKPCTADKEFEPLLQKINVYAENANVFVFVTSAFRTSTNVNGAIVTPAVFSNHLAGHAIDMNVIYGNDQWANSKVLSNFETMPAPVKQFISAIKSDPNLRWGGDFSEKDPVHIDDHLNENKDQWKKRYVAMQRATQLGK